jgi:YgiT-type zinc finger domain-containing protein
MFQCHVCKNVSASHALVSEVFAVDSRRVLVERIPAEVCDRCGEPTFSSETTEKIRNLVRGSSIPVRTDALDLFALT